MKNLCQFAFVSYGAWKLNFASVLVKTAKCLRCVLHYWPTMFGLVFGSNVNVSTLSCRTISNRYWTLHNVMKHREGRTVIQMTISLNLIENFTIFICHMLLNLYEYKKVIWIFGLESIYSFIIIYQWQCPIMLWTFLVCNIFKCQYLIQ